MGRRMGLAYQLTGLSGWLSGVACAGCTRCQHPAEEPPSRNMRFTLLIATLGTWLGPLPGQGLAVRHPAELGLTVCCPTYLQPLEDSACLAHD
jgi:hypothetical protein